MCIFWASKHKAMNTDAYLNMSSVPAGAILYRIAQDKHIHQTTLAQKAGLIPQRINDLMVIASSRC